MKNKNVNAISLKENILLNNFPPKILHLERRDSVSGVLSIRARRIFFFVQKMASTFLLNTPATGNFPSDARFQAKFNRTKGTEGDVEKQNRFANSDASCLGKRIAMQIRKGVREKATAFCPRVTEKDGNRIRQLKRTLFSCTHRGDGTLFLYRGARVSSPVRNELKAA